MSSSDAPTGRELSDAEPVDRILDGEGPPTTSYDESGSSRRARSRGGTVLGAAMLGLGEILEPEKTKVVIEQESDDPWKDADLDLTFDAVPSVDDP